VTRVSSQGGGDHPCLPLGPATAVPRICRQRSDFRRGQAHLKEAADFLVAQVVEVEVWTAGSTANAFPGQPEGKGLVLTYIT